jgi:hypothetical protein
LADRLRGASDIFEYILILEETMAAMKTERRRPKQKRQKDVKQPESTSWITQRRVTPPDVRIRTQYSPTPIPDRNFDWSAVDDNTYEAGHPIGWGETEAEAIADLWSQLEAES